MNTQEVFNKVATHLLSQQIPATKGNRCRYKAEDGKTCAIGCLIPSELYDERMEDAPYNCEFDGCNSIISILKNAGIVEDDLLFEQLRSIHDGVPHDHWLSALTSLAADYELVMPCLPS